MNVRRFRLSARRLAVLAIAAPLMAACSLTDETIGTRPDPAGGGIFRTYMAIGTSVGAGIQSAGINDSTQRQAYPYRLALAMGLTPGVDWEYPSFTMPGCPAPYTNPLTGARVGGPTAPPCSLRDPGSAAPVIHNVSIPSLRAAQVLNITDLTFGPTDTLKLAQFITGSYSPITLVMRARPTFVTLEVGANDVLGAGTRGTPALLTPLASFQATFAAIGDSLDKIGAKVAVFNVPNITAISHFSRGLMFYCLKNGCAPLGIAATPPYSGANFIPAANCAPSAFGPGGVGDSAFVAFTTTAGMTQSLAAGAGITLDCATGAVLINVGAGFVVPTQFPVLTLTPAEYATIATRVADMNTYIAAQATTRGWALVNLNTILLAAAASGDAPPFPNFSNPARLFGPLNPANPDLVSLDGIHPTGAAARLIAQAAAAAINAKFGTAITVP